MKVKIIFLFIAFILSASISYSEVYKWEDEKGVTHYSSKASNPAAKKAELPPINRGEMKLGRLKLISCDSHGGIDCQAGADDDGSVICADSFAGASMVFRFSCNSPRLKVIDISELSQDKLFNLTMRNEKSVGAKSVEVFVNLPTGEEIQLSGPKELDGYGGAEYELGVEYANLMPAKPTAIDIRIDCANCP